MTEEEIAEYEKMVAGASQVSLADVI